MEYFIGAAIALLVAAFAALAGFDREKSFYPTVLTISASYYVLFAVMGGAREALPVEVLLLAAFACVSVAGFRTNPWFVVFGLGAHGIMDLFHGDVIANPGVPEWWPMFCFSYDVAAAGYLAWRLARAERKNRYFPMPVFGPPAANPLARRGGAAH
ncbi:MAG: hypothetical protein ACYCZX_15630 [Rhodospirillaceae bacterium]